MHLLVFFSICISFSFRDIRYRTKTVTVRLGWAGLGFVGWDWAESGHFIVLNYYAGPKMTKNLIFVKALELFKCYRGYLYMTANRNVVHFAHS